jgi:hypothetical protein
MSLVKLALAILKHMADKKPTKKEIEQLQVQIEQDQTKPVRENERRVRIDANLEGAVKRMVSTSPISNEDLVKWARKQKKDTE